MKFSILFFASFFLCAEPFALNSLDTTIIAGTEPISLSLRGHRGSTGSTGSTGSSGSCRTSRDGQGRIKKHHRPGRNGGRGGRGGTGGRGGNLIVIFEDLISLKNIFVDANGGAGGAGGRGGRGGTGCPNGSRGSDGSRGSRGSDGQLFLVPKELTPFQADNSQSELKLSELIQGVKITQRQWTDALGAAQLLAQDSVVLDSYKTLIGYEYGSARVELADRSMVDERLLENAFNVKMQDGNTVITPSSNIMIKSTHSEASANATLVIERLYERSELNSLVYDSLEGTAGNRKIILKTSKPLIPQPQIDLTLTVEVKGFWGFFTLFSGKVDQKFIRSNGEGYEVDLDNLPLSQKILENVKMRFSFEHQLTEGEIKSDKRSEIRVVD